MKKAKEFITILSLSLVVVLSGCDHNVTTGTTVNTDGSLERHILLDEIDSAGMMSNILGVSERDGWDVSTTPAAPEGSGDSDSKYNATFKRTFASADDANAEMDDNADTLFHIQSLFEKESGFFYSTIEYRDTYRALNRFHVIPVEDYFTREDFAFISRLPAEGKAISRADSLYLTRLNEKIFDLYASKTIFEELFRDLVAVMEEYKVESRWQDSLARRKERIYQRFLKSGYFEDDDLLEVLLHPLSPLDTQNIPLPQAGREMIQRKVTGVERRMAFVSKASSGKYLHTIRMPWTVVDTNADSVNNNELYWRPPVVKFLLSDYTMTARSRKLNTWAVVVSAVVIVATLGLFFVRRR